MYEKVRECKSGGGLAIEILKSLNPVWIQDGGADVEVMTVKIQTKNMQIRITNAYGPQEYDSYDKKTKFWNFLDEEVLQCQLDGSACVIMSDMNAWLGKSILKDDPNLQNENVQLFNEFLSRNPQMHLMNASEICEGAITRTRNANDRSERSILDFIIVCSQLLLHVKKCH